MKSKKILAVLFLTVFSIATVAAQGLKPSTQSQVAETQAKIQAAALKLNTLQCNFTQKKEISVLSETVTSKGIMYFKKQDNLRWEYITPYKYLFILSKGKVLIKNDKRIDKFDSRSNKMFKEISEIMIGSVNGSLLSKNDKFTAQYFMGGDAAMVKLIPKSKAIKQLMTSVSLTFSKTNWSVKTIEMVEKGGDKTTINFTGENVNKEISDSLFDTD